MTNKDKQQCQSNTRATIDSTSETTNVTQITKLLIEIYPQDHYPRPLDSHPKPQGNPQQILRTYCPMHHLQPYGHNYVRYTFYFEYQ